MKKKLLVLFGLAVIASSDAQNGFKIYPVPVSNPAYMSNQKTGLAIDNANNKWVCFRLMGLGKFNGSSWTVYNTLNSGLASDSVLAVEPAAANITWVGTAKGACWFDGTMWVTYNTANSGLAGNNVNAINVQGPNVWFATDNGISVFNGTTWSSYSTSNSGLASDTVYTLAFETNGTLWAGTNRGFCSLQGSVWTTYNTSNSVLKSNVVKSIYIDASGVKWIGINGPGYVNTYLPGALYSLTGKTLALISQTISQAPASLATSLASICRGPHGGPLCNVYGGGGGISGMQVGSIAEITSQKTYLYVDSLIETNYYAAYEASTGKIWFVNLNGGTNANPANGPQSGLISFDASAYTDKLNGLNYDNCKDLDLNEVKATMMVEGDMDWNHVSAHYEVPKGGGASAIFASALWIGGLDNSGSLHQAAMTYRQNGYDYWPGPLDTITGGTDSVTAAAYDKIWKVDKYKIGEFIYYFNKGAVAAGTYIPLADILSWPAHGNGKNMHNMAPFIDVNHNGIYDPMTGGDYPDIKGDEMLYWIFNDNLAAHTESGGTPLKVEVHASAYSYSCQSIADSDKVLNYTTFYNYQIFNRSSRNYHKVELGMWEDCDLGLYSDDYVGCNPKGNYGYVYNGANCDGTGSIGTYGCKPPMLSTIILNGPLAVPGDGIDNNNNGVIDEPGERNLMTGFTAYNNDFSVNGNPGLVASGGGGISSTLYPQNFYEYNTGRWKDTSLLTYGGNGVGGSVATRFMFPDFAYDTTGWSEPTAGNPPGDRRFVISCGPFDLKADSMVSFDYAVVFTRDTALAPKSQPFFMKNLADNQKIESWFQQHNAPSCFGFYTGVEDIQKQKPDLEVYPNPAQNILFVNYTLTQGVYKLSVLDLTGKQIILQSELSQGLHTVDISALSEGIYFLRVQDKEGVSCKKFIKR